MTDQPNRKNSLRLSGYDYRQPGIYFVTINSYQHLPIFGELIDAHMKLNPLGEIVNRCWLLIPQKTRYIKLDQYVIMPDHIHGIVQILSNGPEIPEETLPSAEVKAHSLSAVIRTFKAGVTRTANSELDEPPGKIWQRSFNDHIIRKEESLDAVRFYILNNPKRWWMKMNE